MIFLKSENTVSIDSLQKEKVRLTVKGEEPENIWVAKDPKAGKMYLLNHALAFYPLPSWGSEWDLGNTVDVYLNRGDSYVETILTFHPEAYSNIEKYVNPKTDEFNHQAYLNDSV